MFEYSVPWSTWLNNHYQLESEGFELDATIELISPDINKGISYQSTVTLNILKYEDRNEKYFFDPAYLRFFLVCFKKFLAHREV